MLRHRFAVQGELDRSHPLSGGYGSHERLLVFQPRLQFIRLVLRKGKIYVIAETRLELVLRPFP
jgi:hypothetical protein